MKPPKTDMTFDEAYDLRVYEELLEEGIICFHGWEIGKCQEGCEENLKEFQSLLEWAEFVKQIKPLEYAEWGYAEICPKCFCIIKKSK